MSDLSIQPAGKKSTRVAILNSSTLICKGLEFVLQSMSELEFVGSAISTDEALALIRSATPDLIITDVKTVLLDGLLVIRLAKEEQPQVKILVLTAISEESQIFDALWSGADGYCLNDVSSEKVKNAIQGVLSGAIWLDASIASFIKKGAADLRNSVTSKLDAAELPSAPDLSGLTEREISVLELVSLGFSNIRIASELTISAETVKTHIRHIMRKLAVTDRTQAAVIALKRRIVQ